MMAFVISFFCGIKKENNSENINNIPIWENSYIEQRLYAKYLIMSFILSEKVKQINIISKKEHFNFVSYLFNKPNTQIYQFLNNHFDSTSRSFTKKIAHTTRADTDLHSRVKSEGQNWTDK